MTTFDRLQEGSSFENSYENVTTVLEKDNNYVKLKSDKGTVWTVHKLDFNDRVSNRTYKYFKNLKPLDEPTFIPLQGNYKVKNIYPELYDKLIELGYKRMPFKSIDTYYYLYGNEIATGTIYSIFKNNKHKEININQIFIIFKMIRFASR